MASAAVEMLNLSHCRKMMAFNMDLGLDSDTETEVVNKFNGAEGKRMLLEGEEDQGTGHVKKRRKQSKPVRIASSEFQSDEENYVGNLMPDSKKPVVNVSENEVLFCKNSIDENVRRVPTETNNDEQNVKIINGTEVNYYSQLNQDDNYNSNDSSLLPMNLSNARSPTNGMQTGYVNTQASNVNQNQKSEQIRRSNDITPQQFQELGFEGTRFERDTFPTASSASLTFPSLKPVHRVNTPNNSHSQVRHNVSPVRIFNPEAFCELCNKEFCNKYFLKTHKANKHGIYSENSGSNLVDALPTLPFIYFSNANEILPSNSQISRSVMRKPIISTPLPQPNVFIQKSVLSNGNSKAYCNICQREFCNKYFVRKHKAKIHGIIDNSCPDTPPGETQEQKYQSINDLKSCLENYEKCEEHEIYSSLSEHQVAVNLPAELSDDIDKSDQRPCENKSHTLLSEPQSSLRQSRESDSDSCMSSSILRSSTPMQAISSVTLQQDDNSKDVDLSDKTKRIEIMNSEAFCDICCKEYCNKYFLRTHKMKCHGISQPDWEKNDDRLNMFENIMPNSNSHNMPLNLIVGDQNVDKPENGYSELQNGDVYCNLCGQTFKDPFLWKVHFCYKHPQDCMKITNDNSIENEKMFKTKEIIRSDMDVVCTNKLVQNDEKCFDDFQNINSAILQCDICHKGFDPSLLEAHIENDHGNMLDDVTTMAEENSNSQIFQKDNKYDCLMCQRQFLSTSSLNQHIIECHGTTCEQMKTNNIVKMKTTKEIDESPKNNPLHNVLNTNDVQATPTSSFCEICKKELCNKYFMKTHMQRMHGISIDNGAHIGGVVCDICNKELCSKYFLRVHKQNSHGIVDEILGLDISRNQSPSTDPSLRPSEQSDLNNRYFSHFTEVCTICSRRFRSMKWLKAHLLNDHGEEGKNKWKEFQKHYEMKHLDMNSQDIQKKSESLNTVISQNIANNNDNSILSMRAYNDGYSQKVDNSTCQTKGSEENVKTSVFTTIFNGKNTNTKQYHCSYCPFTTSILAFLFVHERSHINGSSIVLEQNKMQCNICLLIFETKESYEKHYISHSLSETSSSSSNGMRMNYSDKVNSNAYETIKKNDIVEQENSTIKDVNDLRKMSPYHLKFSVKGKELRSGENVGRKCEIQNDKEFKAEFSVSESDFIDNYNGPLSEDSRKEYYVSDEKVRRDAEVDDEVNAALVQVRESLELVANKTDIPVSFSLPQTQKHVTMQPFVLEDSRQITPLDVNDTGFKNSFLSSIVFLPVTERVSNSMTVSFKLTPIL